MGQITATRNLVATKVVRLAGQWLFFCIFDYLQKYIQTCLHFVKVTYAIVAYYKVSLKCINYRMVSGVDWANKADRISVHGGVRASFQMI